MTKLLSICIALMLVSTSAAAGGLLVVDPWVRQPPPGARVVGAFMVLKNTADQPAVIAAVESAMAGSVEMHRTVYSEGMARMVAQTSLTVPAQGELVLKPGSYHLMLIHPAAMESGDQVALELKLADGGTVSVVAEVR